MGSLRLRFVCVTVYRQGRVSETNALFEDEPSVYTYKEVRAKVLGENSNSASLTGICVVTCAHLSKIIECCMAVFSCVWEGREACRVVNLFVIFRGFSSRV